MKSIDLQTRTGIAKALAVGFIVFTFLFVQVMSFKIMEHLKVPLSVATILVFTSLVSFLPFVFAFNQKSAEKRSQQRAQRIEAYRASPESHLIHLND